MAELTPTDTVDAIAELLAQDAEEAAFALWQQARAKQRGREEEHIRERVVA